EGLDVGALARTGARAVLVTPAHQFPTGVVLSPARRAELIAWARDADGLILEDDYDAEFRYDREPVGCLQGVDPGRVVLLGSVSKSLARRCASAGPSHRRPSPRGCASTASTPTWGRRCWSSTPSRSSSGAAATTATCARCGGATGAGGTPSSRRWACTCPERRFAASRRASTSTWSFRRGPTGTRSWRGPRGPGCRSSAPAPCGRRNARAAPRPPLSSVTRACPRCGWSRRPNSLVKRLLTVPEGR